MDLSKNSIKVLRCFKKQDCILNLDQLRVLANFSSNEILDCLVFLWKKGYILIIDNRTHELLPMDGRFQITMLGKTYLENHPKYTFIKYYPLVVSTISLIISICVALFKN